MAFLFLWLFLGMLTLSVPMFYLMLAAPGISLWIEGKTVFLSLLMQRLYSGTRQLSADGVAVLHPRRRNDDCRRRDETHGRIRQLVRRTSARGACACRGLLVGDAGRRLWFGCGRCFGTRFAVDPRDARTRLFRALLVGGHRRVGGHCLDHPAERAVHPVRLHHEPVDCRDVRRRHHSRDPDRLGADGGDCHPRAGTEPADLGRKTFLQGSEADVQARLLPATDPGSS